MRQIRQVLRLAYEMGQSQRAISRSLGISRDAVADYLIRARAAGLTWPLPPEMDDAGLENLLFPVIVAPSRCRKVEPDWAAIHLALKQKGATLQGLHEEYLAANPDGMVYSYFCERHREFAKTLKRYMRQTHVAGDKVFVDYAGPTMKIVDPATGEIQSAQIFVGALGASSYIYAEAVWSQKLPQWIASHTRMFEHFGGVPAVVVCDNLKSAVTRASKTDPDIHPTYQDMAGHYGTMIIPARPRMPKDKAHAENSVLIVERWILFRLRKQIFTSLAELNVAIKALLEDANNRPFKKLPGCRRSAFETIDRPALNPLPRERYIYAEFRKVRVGLDYHVELDDRHHYSVPYALVRQEVEVRLTADTVEILHGGRSVASHPRVMTPGKTTNPQHMDPSHRFISEWDAEMELDWALGIGGSTHAFMQVVLAKQTRRELAMRAAGSLKSLAREYGEERIDLACARALEIGATDVRNVKSILRTNLDRRAISLDAIHEASFDHANIRGPHSYH